MSCVAVCCSVLQCVAVCCSVLLFVAVVCHIASRVISRISVYICANKLLSSQIGSPHERRDKKKSENDLKKQTKRVGLPYRFMKRRDQIALFSSMEVSCLETRSSVTVLQCVAVCCSVLRCIAVCCSVLHCVALCCGVETRSSVTVLQCVAV